MVSLSAIGGLLGRWLTQDQDAYIMSFSIDETLQQVIVCPRSPAQAEWLLFGVL